MSNTYKSKEKYKDLITSLKIMHMRVDYNEDTINSDRYKKAYNILEDIQEKRHLTQIGEKGGYREVYNKILEMIEERYIGKESEVLEFTVEGINEICQRYQLEVNEEKAKEEQKEGKER